MFELRVKTSFSAAHHLPGYPGDCARPHGHTWVVEIFVRSKELDSLGMALDFKKVKKAAGEVIGRWDHQDLNTLPDFRDYLPTAELLAKTAYEQMGRALSGERISVDRVTVWESESSSATYWDEEARTAK